MVVVRLPEQLFVVIDCFGGEGSKTIRSIHAESRISLLLENGVRGNYKLAGFVARAGPNIHSGHYVAVVEGPESKWRIVSDSAIHGEAATPESLDLGGNQPYIIL